MERRRFRAFRSASGRGAGHPHLCSKERKDAVRLTGANRFALSFDGKKILKPGAPKNPDAGGEEENGPVDRTYGILDTEFPKQPHKLGEGALNLSGMQAELDPRAEWRQIFNEVWRQERDYFFEIARWLCINWEAQREKYAPLVDHAASRYDLTRHSERHDRGTGSSAHLRGRRGFSRSEAGQRRAC